MRAVSRSLLFAMLVGILALAACSSDEGSSGSPPTTNDEVAGELGEFPGVLGGGLDCLWLEAGASGARRALVLPDGARTKEADGAVVLVVDDRDAAAVGDQVVLTGGFRDDAESCVEGASGAIVVSRVDPAE